MHPVYDGRRAGDVDAREDTDARGDDADKVVELMREELEHEREVRDGLISAMSSAIRERDMLIAELLDDLDHICVNTSLCDGPSWFRCRQLRDRARKIGVNV